MTDDNTQQTNKNIGEICSQYQEERVSGQWYIAQTGLNKVAKILGGNYSSLTKKQRAIFRTDCMENAFSSRDVKTWWYYLNCA